MPDSHNELILAYLPLARRVVRKLRPRLPRYLELTELDAMARLALVRAVRTLRPERTKSIAACLWSRITYGVLDQLRETERSRRITHRPTFVPVEDWHAMAGPDAERRAMAAEVMEIIELLPPRWRATMLMYYVEGLTMHECAMRIGVGQSRVSQIHRAALERMRVEMAARALPKEVE